MEKNKKVIMLGFDGFFPELIDRYKDSIPEIEKMLEERAKMATVPL